MSELEDKIQHLSEEGRHDSAGAFTLDPARAREKLYRFQLPERAYVLNLFASLIAGGSPLEFESSDGSRQPVKSLGCRACGHLWLKLS